MKNLLFILLILSLYGCNKTKTVLICGDHVCVNKLEAQQYFEKNLSLEVQVVNNKKNKNQDLVQLNLKQNTDGKREISVFEKKKTSKKIKKLSNREIKDKKVLLKKNNKIKKKRIKKKISKKKIENAKKNKLPETKKIVNKPNVEIVDICTILKKCSIDEISKYLIQKGKNEKFPDITRRQ